MIEFLPRRSGCALVSMKCARYPMHQDSRCRGVKIPTCSRGWGCGDDYSSPRILLMASNVAFCMNISIGSPVISAAIFIFSASSSENTEPMTFNELGLNKTFSCSFLLNAELNSMILSIFLLGIGRPPENQPRAVCTLTANLSANQALSLPIVLSQSSISLGVMA